jgi:hypothetical protein
MGTRVLWDQILARLPAPEVSEIKKLIGAKLIDEVRTAAREVDALEEILVLYRETLDDERQKRCAKPKLLPPPVMQYVEKELQFFVEHLRERASKHGIAPEAAVRPSTPSEEQVLRYLDAKTSSPMPRPMTAPMGRARARPHTVDGVISSPSRQSVDEAEARLSLERPSTAKIRLNLQEISVANLDSKVLAPLQTAMEAERDGLLAHAEDLRRELDGAHRRGC